MKGAALYKKAAAALLLAVLLLTSVVQITHSHVNKPGITSHSKKAITVNKVIAVQGNDANCFICDYQLAKDADNFFVPAVTITASSFGAMNNGYIIHKPEQTFTQFETRGPPSFFSAI